MTAPVEHYFGAEESRLCYFEWGDPAEPVILLLHATGFHARCWDKVIENLPANHRIIAVDHRGHGRSVKPETLVDWCKTADPLLALIEHLDLQEIIGVGHSMGGHCLVQIASRADARFAQLLLIDPVIMEPDYYRMAPRLDEIDVSSHPIARRRDSWDSPGQFFNRLKNHPSYKIWQPDVLDDYCQYGLLRASGGEGFELACPPLLEASVYAGSLCSNLHDVVATIETPVTILRAPSGQRGGALDFTQSPTFEHLAAAFPHGSDIYIPDLTHFMPMQDPDRIANYIVQIASRV